jgi:hypothetical protein
VNKKHYAFFLKKNRRCKRSNPIAQALKFFTPKMIPNKKKYERKKSRILDRGSEWDMS